MCPGKECTGYKQFNLSSRVSSAGGFVAFIAVCWRNCRRILWTEHPVCRVCVASGRQNTPIIWMSAKIDCQLRQVCLSVFLSARILCTTKGWNFLNEIYMYEDFSKVCRKFKRDWIMKINSVLYLKMCIRYSYGNIWQLLSEKDSVFEAKFVQKFKTHMVFNKYSPKFFHEIMCKKDGRPKQATEYNKVRQIYYTLCTLDNWGYSDTHTYYVIPVDVNSNTPVTLYTCSACLFHLYTIPAVDTQYKHPPYPPATCCSIHSVMFAVRYLGVDRAAGSWGKLFQGSYRSLKK